MLAVLELRSSFCLLCAGIKGMYLAYIFVLFIFLLMDIVV